MTVESKQDFTGDVMIDIKATYIPGGYYFNKVDAAEILKISAKTLQ